MNLHTSEKIIKNKLGLLEVKKSISNIKVIKKLHSSVKILREKSVHKPLGDLSDYIL